MLQGRFLLLPCHAMPIVGYGGGVRGGTSKLGGGTKGGGVTLFSVKG
jgi:hypothetical protein